MNDFQIVEHLAKSNQRREWSFTVSILVKIASARP